MYKDRRSFLAPPPFGDEASSGKDLQRLVLQSVCPGCHGREETTATVTSRKRFPRWLPLHTVRNRVCISLDFGPSGGILTHYDSRIVVALFLASNGRIIWMTVHLVGQLSPFCFHVRCSSCWYCMIDGKNPVQLHGPCKSTREIAA